MQTFADLFLLTLAVTTVLRGLAAGMIAGVVLITFPSRRRLGLIPYAQFARAQFKGGGVRAYAAITVLGAVFTLALWIATYRVSEPSMVSWWIVISLIATALGFVGTGGAFPAMLRLWQTSDAEETLVAHLLDGFAYWGIFSAIWHAVAFSALVCALATARPL